MDEKVDQKSQFETYFYKDLLDQLRKYKVNWMKAFLNRNIKKSEYYCNLSGNIEENVGTDMAVFANQLQTKWKIT